MQNSITKIAVTAGQEYMAKEENIYDSESFFFDSYRRAAECLEEVLLAQRQFEELENIASGINDMVEPMLNSRLLNSPNNIIAFCAERGQGKTSAMMSFAKALSSRHIPNTEFDSRFVQQGNFWKNTTKGYQFQVVNCIDPTTMIERDSILKAILIQMFGAFNERREASIDKVWNNQDKREHEYALVKMFRKCFHHIKMLNVNTASEDNDDLEQIVELGGNSNLRAMLHKLVKKFLEYMCAGKKGILVLQIDDTDLNIKRAYDIVEDLRKYMFIPNVVILMALNMPQLESTVEQHFIDEYATSLKNNGMAGVDTCHKIAERYIDKVLPSTRQIDLPDLNVVLKNTNIPIKLIYIERKEGVDRSLLPSDDCEGMFLQEQLLNLLYKKTGVLFLKPREGRHSLLPRTMRELTHFLKYFTEMQDVITDENEQFLYRPSEDYIQRRSENVKALKRYILNVWSAQHIPDSARQFLHILDAEPYAGKNLQVMNFLLEYYVYEMSENGFTRGISSRTAQIHREQFVKACKNHSIATGIDGEPLSATLTYSDINEATYLLTDYLNSVASQDIASAIRMYYSICMHEMLIRCMQNQLSINGLIEFIGEFSFKPNRVNYTASSEQMGRFEIDGAALLSWLRISNSANNKKNYAIINELCRIKTGDHTQEIDDVESLFERIEDGERIVLVVDVLFPVFHMLSAFSNISLGEDGAVETGENQRNMLGCLNICLNWDVQDKIRQSIYKLDSDLLADWIRRVYDNIGKTFAEIEYVDTGHISEVFKLFYRDAKVVYFSIQMSSFVHLKKKLLDMRSALQRKVAQVNNPENDEMPVEWKRQNKRILDPILKQCEYFCLFMDKENTNCTQITYEDAAGGVAKLISFINSLNYDNENKWMETLVKFHIDIIELYSQVMQRVGSEAHN